MFSTAQSTKRTGYSLYDRIFLSSTASIPAPSPLSKPHTQYVPTPLSLRARWPERETSHPHLIPKGKKVFKISPQLSTFYNTGWRKKNVCFEMGSSRESFFLWGYLESKVYVRKPRTVDDLKVFIREEIATVPQEMLVNVMQNFEERLRTCLRQEGRHLSDIVFRNLVINVTNQNSIYYRLFWC